MGRHAVQPGTGQGNSYERVRGVEHLEERNSGSPVERLGQLLYNTRTRTRFVSYENAL